MQCRKSCNRCGTGHLPSRAPLANPYVPFQKECSEKYEPRKALIRGTLYQGLDLPFMGMVNKQEKPVTPLSEVQALSFVIQELVLYLDTHPGDKETLELLTHYQDLYAVARRNYERTCGSLTHMSPMQGEYCWLNDPWPWEYAKNRGV